MKEHDCTTCIRGAAPESLIRPSAVSGNAGDLETRRVSNLQLTCAGAQEGMFCAEYASKLPDPKRKEPSMWDGGEDE